ncbi:hypothetical protein ML462_01020 [Gramella lutea]|uniref:DUF4239 domain-containing protein n=1 Tax=Christiangramia lutea TaxID=1607951 RepID=A0A9X2A7Z8_9FLAO|nr:hypothetical protein [Christiangramia lutea]MCH4821740.1 hypothetical protein [Christiangramia lutea]
MSVNFFQSFPFWGIYISIFILILISIGFGITYYKWRQKKVAHEDEVAINTLVGATLGLLAFILAFTFGLSSSRFEARKQFQLDEVNAIETAWLRARLLESPYSEKFQKLLVEYTEVRIWFLENKDKVAEAITKSENIQNEIWSLTVRMNHENIGKPPINSLFISAVNDMFDLQTSRISKGVIDHIPGLIWISLFILVSISMFEVGYLMGKSKKKNWVLILALSLSFSAIILLIVDLDSFEGNISLDHQVIYDMYNRIN